MMDALFMSKEPHMKCTEREILQYVEENDVKFVKLTFCDIFGKQKNSSIVSSSLASAFKNEISFDASAVTGFIDVEKSDLLLFPDPGTLSVLPWRPQSGRVISLLCNIKHPNGNFFAADSLPLLQQSTQKRDRNPKCRKWRQSETTKALRRRCGHAVHTYEA